MDRNPPRVPAPAVMPIDREAWGAQLSLSNFINAFCEFRDLQVCGDLKTVLVIGPGQGLDTQVLRWRGYEVTTFDIDTAFRPDVVGSVHEMGVFPDGRFDAVIASHVLEHLAEPYLDRSLGEIARVGKFALVYLPVAGRHVHLRFAPGVKGIDLSVIADVFNWFRRPDGVTPRYAGGQHFWELGMPGYRLKDILVRMERFFEVVSVYRNKDWNPSRNFILKSRRAA